MISFSLSVFFGVLLPPSSLSSEKLPSRVLLWMSTSSPLRSAMTTSFSASCLGAFSSSPLSSEIFSLSCKAFSVSASAASTFSGASISPLSSRAMIKDSSKSCSSIPVSITISPVVNKISMEAYSPLPFAPNTTISCVITSPCFSSIILPDVSFAKNLPFTLLTVPIAVDMKKPLKIFQLLNSLVEKVGKDNCP